MNNRVDTYEDFVAWRDDHDCEKLTVGDAMRYFTGTPYRHAARLVDARPPGDGRETCTLETRLQPKKETR